MKKFALAFVLTFACDDATTLVVDDTYTDQTQVDAVWWSETYVPDVVASGASSPSYRTVPGSAYAYAVIERAGVIFPVRTSDMLSLERQNILHVTISPSTVVGDCKNGAPLTQVEADFITQSIFPALFAGTIYDASTCKLARPTPPPDAGTD